MLIVNFKYVCLKSDHWVLISTYLTLWFDPLLAYFFLDIYKWPFSIVIATYPVLLYIGGIRASQWPYLNKNCWFCVLTPFYLYFWSFLDIYSILEPGNIISDHLVSLLLPIHLYYILMELEQHSDLIWIIIDKFGFSPL